jgi:hypothetical protein
MGIMARRRMAERKKHEQKAPTPKPNLEKDRKSVV